MKKKLLALCYPLIQFYWKHFGASDAARVIILHKGAILLVKKSYVPGRWFLPGGLLKKGESPEEAVRREVLEELDVPLVEVRSADAPDINNKKGRKEYTFVADLTSLEIHKDNVEIEAAQWFPVDDLPKNGPSVQELLHFYYSSQEILL